jgi:WD40 repeat protein
VAGIFFSCKSKRDQPYSGEKTMAEADTSARIHFPGEKHLRNIHQLTFGGDNAEAYWSFSGNKIVFQRADHTQYRCDQIFTGSVEDYLRRTNETEFLMKQDSGGMAFQLSSTGKGRTTCAAFLPGDSTILFASTHLAADSCPPVPDRKKIGRYVWPIYDSYEIFVADLNGNILRQLTNNNHYDAEATLSPKGDRIIFTSTRDGDLELYTMNLDGSNVSRITHEQGYDGGAWFSPDGSQIIWRASRPEVQEEKNDYRRLLKQQLVAPNKMDVWVANADGSDAKKITEMKGANWAPVFTPDGKQILFASNSKYDRGFPFDLYLINLDGTGLEQVTFSQSFDAFPMFSYDGKYLIWCSNRNNGGGRDTNIFIAEWVP